MFPLIGFRKKVESLAKEKDCVIVREWTKSMINHIYWSAVSTPNGDEDMHDTSKVVVTGQSYS